LPVKSSRPATPIFRPGPDEASSWANSANCGCRTSSSHIGASSRGCGNSSSSSSACQEPALSCSCRPTCPCCCSGPTDKAAAVTRTLSAAAAAAAAAPVKGQPGAQLSCKQQKHLLQPIPPGLTTQRQVHRRHHHQQQQPLSQRSVKSHTGVPGAATNIPCQLLLLLPQQPATAMTQPGSAYADKPLHLLNQAYIHQHTNSGTACSCTSKADSNYCLYFKTWHMPAWLSVRLTKASASSGTAQQAVCCSSSNQAGSDSLAAWQGCGCTNCRTDSCCTPKACARHHAA
jgi:hypothetical protein